MKVLDLLLLHISYILRFRYIISKSKDRMRKVKNYYDFNRYFQFLSVRNVASTRCLSLAAFLFKTDVRIFGFLKSGFPSAIFINQMTQSLTDLLETIRKIVPAENQCFVLRDNSLTSATSGEKAANKHDHLMRPNNFGCEKSIIS